MKVRFVAFSGERSGRYIEMALLKVKMRGTYEGAGAFRSGKDPLLGTVAGMSWNEVLRVFGRHEILLSV